MLTEMIEEALVGARGLRALADVKGALYRAIEHAQIGDEDAARIEGAILAREAALRTSSGSARGGAGAGAGGLRRRTIFPVRKRQRRPDAAKARARKLKCCGSGKLPPGPRATLLPSEQAALTIVAFEIIRRGSCELPLDAIAAQAGVSRTTVRNALRRAAALGLCRVTQRPRRGAKSDTNLVEALPIWRSWLRIGARPAIGRNRLNPLESKDNYKGCGDGNGGRAIGMEHGAGGSAYHGRRRGCSSGISAPKNGRIEGRTGS